MGKGDRPEHSAPPELFYDDSEAAKYTTSSRVMEIQEKLTLRALELLALEDDGVPKMILDVGCGSGLSGQVLTEQGVPLCHEHHCRVLQRVQRVHVCGQCASLRVLPQDCNAHASPSNITQRCSRCVQGMCG